MSQNVFTSAFLSLCVALASHAFAEEQEIAKPLLQVIRLKPGEQRFIEVALPLGEFRPAGKSGRSDLAAEFFSERAGDKFVPIVQGKPTKNEFFKAAPYPLAEGLTLRWSEDKPGLEFEASQNAQPITKDIRVTYTNFGGKTHAIGFQVIVSE